jgi:uncharacterized protein (DUF1697 family)
MPNKSTGYVALLRGINVGGNSLVKMGPLKNVFESLGFENVRTLLASGNVLFETTETDISNLKQKIEKELENSFKRTINVNLRSIQKIQDLVDSDPFKNIKLTPKTRLNVTFLPGDIKSNLKIPYRDPETDFQIVSSSSGNLCWALEPSVNHGTVDAMSFIEKEFGKNVTTRSWNTVCKILKK